ncbi:MAG: glycogen/starch synthase [Simkaniaceae bacterium]|nr:glycogen/starch synthase [Simkaniaceae bacterium]
MQVLHVTSEIAPIAKAGGLGDVVYGLSKHMIATGHSVTAILPFYDCLDREPLSNLQEIDSFTIEDALGEHNCQIFSASLHTIPLLLIKLPHPDHYFETIYGGLSENRRFLYFAKAALHTIEHLDLHADVLHLHDWVTGSLFTLLHTHYKGQLKRFKGTMLSIHNLKHQGHAIKEDFDFIGVNGSAIAENPLYHDPNRSGDINLLKGAIEHAGRVVAVSPTYAKEILKKENAYYLHDTIAKHRYKITGIINGIETTYWSLEKDALLPYRANYSDPLPRIYDAKRSNREHLLSELGLALGGEPLYCAITRLVSQKSPHLIECAINYILKNRGTFILLGSGADKETQEHFLQLKKSYNDHPRLHMHFDLDEGLAHRVYASADAIVIPSLFEPCGLTQMIAMRYGTLPIVRRTGGLADTVSEKNGFIFDEHSPDALSHCLEESLLLYRTHPDKWRDRQQAALKTDFSWEKPAQEYLNEYTKCLT